MTSAAGLPLETTPELRYQILRVALGRFETPPAELEPARLEEARRLARRQQELELLVLGSSCLSRWWNRRWRKSRRAIPGRRSFSMT